MTTPLVTKVLLADDHPIVLRGLRDLLNAEADFRVVAEAADGAEAVQMAVDGLRSVAGLRDDLEVGLLVEHEAEPAQDDRVVVGEQDAALQRDGHQASTGTRRTTSVPPASAGPIDNSAPMSIARSRMPRMPFDDAAASGGSPRPSSRTRSTAYPSSRRSEISTVLARA